MGEILRGELSGRNRHRPHSHRCSRHGPVRDRTHGLALRKRSSRVVYRRITRSRDRDLRGVVAFHNRSFDPRLGRRWSDIARWIKDCEQQKKLGEELEWDEHLIVATQGTEIIGYLYGSYHTPTRFLFISYFATNQSDFAATDKIGRKMLGYLLSLFEPAVNGVASARTKSFRAVVAELDLEKIRDGRSEASWFGDYFGYHARGLGYSAYVIDGIDYKQPLIDLEDIRAKWKRRKGVPLNGAQLLLYVPAVKPNPECTLSGEGVRDILRFIVLEVYPDSYDFDEKLWEEYKTYATAVLAEMERQIGASVAISPAMLGA